MRQDLAAWNDAMYQKHPTPYGRGIAGAISTARVRTVLRLAKVQPRDAVLEHVERPRTVLEQVHAIATPATRVVITVPNERPKLVIKDILRWLHLFERLFPGIEVGQSEWHLQQFSKPLIRATVKDLFTVRSLESVWGCHYAALLAQHSRAAT